MGFRRLGQASGGSSGSISQINGSSSIDVTGGSGPTATIAVKDGGVSTAKLADVNVTTGKIADNAVTNAKLAQAPTATIKGNKTAGTANVADLTVAEVTTLIGLGTAAFQATTAFDAAGAAAAAQAASQPLSANLTSLAGVASTAYGRSLLTLASAVADAESLGSEIPTAGSNLSDANATITIAGGAQYVLPAATLTANRVLTLGVTGSPLTGEIISVLRRGTEAFTYTIQDDAATVLFTMPVSTRFAAYFRYNGTHFTLSSAVRIQ